MSEQSSRPSPPPPSTVPLSSDEIEEVKIPPLPPPLATRPSSSARGASANGAAPLRAGSSPALRPGSSPALRQGSSPDARSSPIPRQRSSPDLKSARAGSSADLKSAPAARAGSSADLKSARARPGSSPAIAPPPKQADRAKRIDNEDDPASVFDVDTHAPQEQEIPVETSFGEQNDQSSGSGLIDLQSVLAQFEDTAPKPVDDDMVHLSGNLFGGGGSAPLVAPDIASLMSSPPNKAGASSREVPSIKALDDAAPLLAPVMSLEQAAQKKSVRPKSAQPGVKVPSWLLHAAVWMLGLGICGAAAYGVFKLAMRKPAPDKPAVAQQAQASPNDEPLGVRRPGEPESTTSESTSAPQDAPKTGATKPAVAQAGPASGKPAASAKGDEPADPGAEKPAEAEPEPPPAQDPGAAKQAALAAALAAAPTGTNVAGPPRPRAPAVGADFDTGAASAALNAASGAARGCKQEGDPSGPARVSITFAPSGRVTSAKVQGPPFAGTPTGGCIASAFRSASVPPFEGSPVTVNKTINIR